MNRGSGHLKLKDTSAYWEGILTESITKGGRRRPFASKAGYCPTANWFMGDSKGEFVVGASMKLYQGIGNGVEAGHGPVGPVGRTDRRSAQAIGLPQSSDPYIGAPSLIVATTPISNRRSGS